jgi:hypothetical protein
MAQDWTTKTPDEKIEWLYAALQSLEKDVGAAQDDVAGLSRRVVELDLQQRSTFELATEVVATVERIDAGQ